MVTLPIACFRGELCDAGSFARHHPRILARPGSAVDDHHTHPRRRRRTRHRRPDQAHARTRAGYRRDDGRQRRRGAQGRGRAAAAPHHPRPEPAGPVRIRRVPDPAFAADDQAGADHHADGADDRGRSRVRARPRRRRLRHQAVQPARTRGARARGAAPAADLASAGSGAPWCTAART